MQRYMRILYRGPYDVNIEVNQEGKLVTEFTCGSKRRLILSETGDTLESVGITESDVAHLVRFFADNKPAMKETLGIASETLEVPGFREEEVVDTDKKQTRSHTDKSNTCTDKPVKKNGTKKGGRK